MNAYPQRTAASSQALPDWSTWTTDTCARTDAADYWHEVVCRGVLIATMTPFDSHGNDGFVGRMASRSDGGNRFVRFNASAHRISRKAREAEQSADGCFMISAQWTGNALMSQGGQSARLVPADIGVLDAAQPFEILFPERVERRLVMISKDAFELAPGRATPLALSASHPFAPALHELIRQVTEPATTWRPQQASHLLEAISALLAQGLRDSDMSLAAPGAREQKLMRRLRLLVDERLCDASFDASCLARELGLSLRSLYRLLASERLTFSAYLAERRLDAARARLSSGVRGKRISDIAFEVGFNDPSAFSRAFKRRFGVSPREVG